MTEDTPLIDRVKRDQIFDGHVSSEFAKYLKGHFEEKNTESSRWPIFALLYKDYVFDPDNDDFSSINPSVMEMFVELVFNRVCFSSEDGK